MQNLHCEIENLVHRAVDPRADGGTRTVWLTQRDVRIERTVRGMKMRLSIPIEAYRGVVLTCMDGIDRSLCCVTLDHNDSELSIGLHEGKDAAAVLQIWLGWARFLARPALCSGALRDVAHPHRRGMSLANRRPRFLEQRRPAPRRT